MYIFRSWIFDGGRVTTPNQLSSFIVGILSPTKLNRVIGDITSHHAFLMFLNAHSPSPTPTGIIFVQSNIFATGQRFLLRFLTRFLVRFFDKIIDNIFDKIFEKNFDKIFDKFVDKIFNKNFGKIFDKILD